MESSYLSELEAGLELVSERHRASATGRTGVGILIADPVNRRLVEAASLQLDLLPTALTEAETRPETLSELELIVADEPLARKIRRAFLMREEKGEGIHPAVIAVVASAPAGAADDIVSPNLAETRQDHNFDGLLRLPMAPAALAAQLSIIRYAHRAFTRRYHSALEELNLNRRIFRSVTSGISVSNATRPDFPLVYVNPAFEVMTGYSLEEVQGRNCRFLQGSEKDQPALTLIREAIKGCRETTAILKNFARMALPSGTSFRSPRSVTATAN